jgi:hypothetical protein
MILAIAFETLHFKQFAKYTNSNDNILVDESKILESFEEFPDLSLEFKILLEKYEVYKKETEEGNHGLTAQLWMIYIKMVNLYNLFSQSVQTSNFEHHLHFLKLINDLFFVFNNSNSKIH